MKKISKKIVSLMLAAFMLFGIAPLTAFMGIEMPAFTSIFVPEASADYAYGKFGEGEVAGRLSIQERHLIIGGKGEITYRIVNSSFNNSGTSTNVGKWIRTAKVDNGITGIGDFVFSDCSNLTKVNIANSVIKIGKSAFKGCTALKSLSIPDSVTEIGANAFENTGIYNNTENWVNDVLYIGKHLIKAKTTISGSYTVKDGTILLADESFKDCKGLTEIILPDSLKAIGAYAFYNCDGLVEIVVPDGVTKIGDYAFANCDSLKCVHIPSSVTEIGENILAGTNAYICYDDENCYAKEYADKNGIDSTTHQGLHFCDHSYSSKITVNPTCTVNGEKTFTCTLCGFAYKESVPASHKIGDWQTVVQATAATEGKMVRNCTVCGVTLEEKTIERLKEAAFDKDVINTPSITTINYGDSIVLHTNGSKIPAGGRIEWTASNGNFSYSPNSSTCIIITPKSSGDTTFTATVYDANGNEILKDEQVMTSKAGFFNRLIAFFKGLFGLTKTYDSHN